MINEILLRRRNHIYLEERLLTGSGDQSLRVLTMMKNIESLGYIFSRELYKRLCATEKGALDAFYLELVRLLKTRVGADHEWRPMYPNFPQEVMERSREELYLNAVVHYWSGGAAYPPVQKQERLPVPDETKAVVLSSGTREELPEIFRNLAEANGSWSEQDRQDIRWYFANVPDAAEWLPDRIPEKENAAYIGKCCLELCPLTGAGMLKKYFRTAADVLRLSAALSGGDVSLAKKVRFRSFRRQERRILMDLLSEASAQPLGQLSHPQG